MYNLPVLTYLTLFPLKGNISTLGGNPQGSCWLLWEVHPHQVFMRKTSPTLGAGDVWGSPERRLGELKMQNTFRSIVGVP